MYNVVSVGKLSETQKSKLRNGHPTRIIKGTANQLHLTNEQLKKFEAAARKGKAYTVTLNPEQAEKHGAGIFGNIASKMKKFAIKHKDVLNPILAGLKTGAKKGASKLAEAAQDKVIEYAQKAQDKIDSKINPIEGSGIKRRGRPKKTGEGLGMLLGPLIKLAAPMVIDAVAGAAKKRMGGSAKKKNGGALMPAGSKAGMGISEAKALANKMREARYQARYLNKDHIKVIDGTGAKRKAGRPRKRTGGALMPA
jgi:hypothetical protein